MNRLADTNVWNDARSYLPDLSDNLAEIEYFERVALHYRRQAYKLRVQKVVRSFCLAVAVFAIVWIGGLELIGLVK